MLPLRVYLLRCGRVDTALPPNAAPAAPLHPVSGLHACQGGGEGGGYFHLAIDLLDKMQRVQIEGRGGSVWSEAPISVPYYFHTSESRAQRAARAARWRNGRLPRPGPQPAGPESK